MRWPNGLHIPDEIALRQQRLVHLAQAKTILQAWAQERYEAEKAPYEAKVQAKKAAKTKRKPGGPPNLAPDPKTRTTSPIPTRRS